MERFKNISTEELKKRINERQQFLEKVAVFVADIAPKIGKITRQSESSSCTSTDWEVISFGDFSFEYHTGWGYEYVIYYHPQLAIFRLNAMTSDLVFEEGAGHEKKYAVRSFNEDSKWQIALLSVIEHKDELLAQRKKTEEERQEKIRLQTAEERKRAKLIEEAERLKL